MDWIVKSLNDPFVGLGILGVLSAYFWWIRRHDPKPTKTRMPTVEEAKALGIPLDMRSFYVVDVEPASKTVHAPMQASPMQVTPAPVQVQSIKLSTIADDTGPVNILVVGAKGSGKTVVLRTLLVRRAPHIDACLSIDSHASPGKWPCSVVGGGLDYRTIDSALRTMSADMKLRFGQLRDGEIKEGAFDNRYYVGDEWPSVAAELNGKDGAIHAGKMLIERLINGRKVNDAIMAAAQNDTVDALGIQGNASIKACFDYIVYLGGIAADRPKYHGCPASVIDSAMAQARPGLVWITFRNQWAVLDYDIAPVLEGTTVVNLFAPFVSQTSVGTSIPVSPDVPVSAGITPDTAHDTSIAGIDTDPALSDTEIRSLYSSGLSKNKIAERLAGKKQDRLARIADALAEPDDFVFSENDQAVRVG